MDIQNTLKEIFRLVGLIPVQDQYVDIMYEVRQGLRTVYNEVAQTNENEQKQEKE